ncbi:transcriptional regulator swi6 [Phlyctochytrium planicorne]|nr:transcriptional regulator swi6 [Phlyctochytrium planicorne]
MPSMLPMPPIVPSASEPSTTALETQTAAESLASLSVAPLPQPSPQKLNHAYQYGTAQGSSLNCQEPVPNGSILAQKASDDDNGASMPSSAEQPTQGNAASSGLEVPKADIASSEASMTETPQAPLSAPANMETSKEVDRSTADDAKDGGAYRPASSDPSIMIYRAVYRGITVLELKCKEGLAMRRMADSYVNISLLLGVAGIHDREIRRAIFKNEVTTGTHEYVRGGGGNGFYQGIWVPLERAVGFAKQKSVYELLRPLLEYDEALLKTPERIPTKADFISSLHDREEMTLGRGLVYITSYRGVQVFEMTHKGNVLMRRISDSWMSATQILLAAGVTNKDERRMTFKNEVTNGEHEYIRGGNGAYQGIWTPFERAIEFARNHGMYEAILPLIELDVSQPDKIHQRYLKAKDSKDSKDIKEKTSTNQSKPSTPKPHKVDDVPKAEDLDRRRSGRIQSEEAAEKKVEKKAQTVEKPQPTFEKAEYSGNAVYEISCRGVAVMKRIADSFMNSSQILKLAGIFNKEVRRRIYREEVTSGPYDRVQVGGPAYQGLWFPAERAREFAKKHGVFDLVEPVVELEIDSSGEIVPKSEKEKRAAEVEKEEEKTTEAESKEEEDNADDAEKEDEDGDESCDQTHTVKEATYKGLAFYQLKCKRVQMMIRVSDSFMSATQILKLAGINKNRRKQLFKESIKKGVHEKIGGNWECQGIWIPLERAVTLAKEFEVYDFIKPLLDHAAAANGSNPAEVDGGAAVEENSVVAEEKEVEKEMEKEEKAIDGIFEMQVDEPSEPKELPTATEPVEMDPIPVDTGVEPIAIAVEPLAEEQPSVQDVPMEDAPAVIVASSPRTKRKLDELDGAVDAETRKYGQDMETDVPSSELRPASEGANFVRVVEPLLKKLRSSEEPVAAAPVPIASVISSGAILHSDPVQTEAFIAGTPAPAVNGHETAVSGPVVAAVEGIAAASEPEKMDGDFGMKDGAIAAGSTRLQEIVAGAAITEKAVCTPATEDQKPGAMVVEKAEAEAVPAADRPKSVDADIPVVSREVVNGDIVMAEGEKGTVAVEETTAEKVDVPKEAPEVTSGQESISVDAKVGSTVQESSAGQESSAPKEIPSNANDTPAAPAESKSLEPVAEITAVAHEDDNAADQVADKQPLVDNDDTETDEAEMRDDFSGPVDRPPLTNPIRISSNAVMDGIPIMKPPSICTAVYKNMCVYEMKHAGALLTKRKDDSYLNATHILQAAGLSPFKRREVCKEVTQGPHDKVVGKGHCQGIWVPSEIGVELAHKYGVYETLVPLLTNFTDSDRIPAKSQNIMEVGPRKKALVSRKSSIHEDVETPSVSVPSTPLPSPHVKVAVKKPGANPPRVQKRKTPRLPIDRAHYETDLDVIQMMCKGTLMMKSTTDDHVNTSQIFRLAEIDRKKGRKILKREVLKGPHKIIREGISKVRGVWVPLQIGIDLARRFGVYEHCKTLYNVDESTIPPIGYVSEPEAEVEDDADVEAVEEEVVAPVKVPKKRGRKPKNREAPPAPEKKDEEEEIVPMSSARRSGRLRKTLVDLPVASTSEFADAEDFEDQEEELPARKRPRRASARGKPGPRRSSLTSRRREREDLEDEDSDSDFDLDSEDEDDERLMARYRAAELKRKVAGDDASNQAMAAAAAAAARRRAAQTEESEEEEEEEDDEEEEEEEEDDEDAIEEVAPRVQSPKMNQTSSSDQPPNGSSPAQAATASSVYGAVYDNVAMHEMVLGNVAIMRRKADSYMNLLQILEAAGINQQRCEAICDKEVSDGGCEKVDGGDERLRGTWIPIEKAAMLARKYKIYERLKPLLQFDATTLVEADGDDGNRDQLQDVLGMGDVVNGDSGPDEGVGASVLMEIDAGSMLE